MCVVWGRYEPTPWATKNAGYDCEAARASTQEQSISWLLSFLLSELGVIVSTINLLCFYYMREETRDSVVTSFMAMVVPDFVISWTMFLMQGIFPFSLSEELPRRDPMF